MPFPSFEALDNELKRGQRPAEIIKEYELSRSDAEALELAIYVVNDQLPEFHHAIRHLLDRPRLKAEHSRGQEEFGRALTYALRPDRVPFLKILLPRLAPYVLEEEIRAQVQEPLAEKDLAPQAFALGQLIPAAVKARVNLASATLDFLDEVTTIQEVAERQLPIFKELLRHANFEVPADEIRPNRNQGPGAAHGLIHPLVKLLLAPVGTYPKSYTDAVLALCPPRREAVPALLAMEENLYQRALPQLEPQLARLTPATADANRSYAYEYYGITQAAPHIHSDKRIQQVMAVLNRVGPDPQQPRLLHDAIRAKVPGQVSALIRGLGGQLHHREPGEDSCAERAMIQIMNANNWRNQNGSPLPEMHDDLQLLLNATRPAELAQIRARAPDFSRYLTHSMGLPEVPKRRGLLRR